MHLQRLAQQQPLQEQRLLQERHQRKCCNLQQQLKPASRQERHHIHMLEQQEQQRHIRKLVRLLRNRKKEQLRNHRKELARSKLELVLGSMALARGSTLVLELGSKLAQGSKLALGSSKQPS
ncbi:MAG: hypothetical protein RH917_10375 [Lacipirellulaceae bacterium]